MDPPTPATATKTTKDGEHFVLEDGAGTGVEATPATVVTNAPTEPAAPDTPTEGADGATDNREDATDAPKGRASRRCRRALVCALVFASAHARAPRDLETGN